MSINDVINFQRFIELVTLLSTFVMSPKLLRPSFKIFCAANKSLYLYILNTKVGYFLIPYKYINFKIKLHNFCIPSSIKQPLLQQMFLFDNIILLNLLSKPPYVLY